jgi:hypothetical protein
MELTRPPMSEASRNRLERRMYPEENNPSKNAQSASKAGSGAGHRKGDKDSILQQEGVKLDIATERLRESETSRGWAIRQVYTLHREMQRYHQPSPHAKISKPHPASYRQF